MAYKVLYRKYRPKTFKDIIGQDTIVDVLKKSLIEGSISHAYIFTGPRGTGKTSTAKVFSKAINCLNLKDGEPCDECDNCKNFSSSPDIIEIDAASNNGVDEIRELRSNVTLAPSSSKYKVYIIDEVHMLSPGAFNALLKTLEEPPAHAIFILATTEVYKVPITILSRCQRFDFKKISETELINHLKYVCNKEKITFEDEALEEIYSLSEGCLRDALSILDQSSKISKKITLNDILLTYNTVSNNTIKNLLKCSETHDITGIVDQIEELEKSGVNAQKFLKKTIKYLEEIAIETKLGSNNSYEFNSLYSLISNLNRCYMDARINENIFSLIKLNFIELADYFNNTSDQNKTFKKEKKDQIYCENIDIKAIRINNCFVDAKKEYLSNLATLWKELENKKVSSIIIQNYKPVASSSTYAIFTADENSLVNLFNIKCEQVEKLLKKNGFSLKVVALTVDDWQTEKEKYKKNIKSQKKYEYIDEPIKTNDKKEIEELFVEKVVDIS